MYQALFAVSLWILTLFPALIQAQVEPDGPRRAAFQTLSDSQWVRVATPEFGRREGRVLDQSLRALVLSEEPQPLHLPATSIDTLWTRGSSAKIGAIAGALIGAALGTGLGVLCGETGNDCNTGEAIALFGGIGLGGGGLLGAVIGAGLPRWHRRYP